MRVVGHALVLVATCGMLLSGGCAVDPTQGYSSSPTYDQDIRSVTVPVFANETYASGLEAHLTDAIIKEIQSRTPWVVVPSGGTTTLNGVITSGDAPRTLSTNRETGLVEEQAVQVTVDFEWRDNRTGETLVARRGFSSAATFIPARPVGERFETGQYGAVQELARDIVGEMRSKW